MTIYLRSFFTNLAHGLTIAHLYGGGGGGGGGNRNKQFCVLPLTLIAIGSKKPMNRIEMERRTSSQEIKLEMVFLRMVRRNRVCVR